MMQFRLIAKKIRLLNHSQMLPLALFSPCFSGLIIHFYFYYQPFAKVYVRLLLYIHVLMANPEGKLPLEHLQLNLLKMKNYPKKSFSGRESFSINFLCSSKNLTPCRSEKSLDKSSKDYQSGNQQKSIFCELRFYFFSLEINIKSFLLFH